MEQLLYLPHIFDHPLTSSLLDEQQSAKAVMFPQHNNLMSSTHHFEPNKSMHAVQHPLLLLQCRAAAAAAIEAQTICLPFLRQDNPAGLTGVTQADECHILMLRGGLIMLQRSAMHSHYALFSFLLPCSLNHPEPLSNCKPPIFRAALQRSSSEHPFTTEQLQALSHPCCSAKQQLCSDSCC
jgi:hypothetical protein